MDYSLPKYDQYRKHISKSRDRKISWEDIMNGFPDKNDSLEAFIEKMIEDSYWEITPEDWKRLVILQESSEKNSIEFQEVDNSNRLVGDQTVSDITVPSSPESAWQKYRARLEKNGFRNESIVEIENSTLTILSMLQKDSKETRKGLVVGNVQSGKTANMAALMAMAADWGWNMFIILSGTIENLRVQTQNRLLEDLDSDGSTIKWRGIMEASIKIETDKTSNLSFSNKSANFTVCLKNKKRLENLIKWLNHDEKRKPLMKIIIIDDEADQAGINTADVTKEERKTINRLIVNLVGNKSVKGVSYKSYFKAMNYIGYTATPYANLLNETAEESLYPKSFIATLSNPPEYFGPQIIFGVEGIGDGENPERYDGLNIIRSVDKDDLKTLKDIHDGDISSMPISLKKALAWFLSGTAALRYQGYRKPLSMLIHTSPKQNHHQYLADCIEEWIEDSDLFIQFCENVYQEEIKSFTKEHFIDYLPGYPNGPVIVDYPSFDKIREDLRKLISKVTSIPLDQENELNYLETLHLCIDNCANNGIDDEGMFKRLVYPNKDKLKKMSYAPAFVVVGGATLSRGLTIEGLISTYFLRDGRQADTLMQMGRWFGYRKGYELYPRIWMTANTYDQFRFLSTLDTDLRNEIRDMSLRGVSPMQYGPRINNIPRVKSMRITAANKMQKAVETDLDYTGSHNQTVIFVNEKDILERNITITEEFLAELDAPVYSRDNTALIWRDVECKTVFEEFLAKFAFSSNNVVFSNIKGLYKWVKEITEENKLESWNVVVAGLKPDNKKAKFWSIGNNYKITKVNRTRKKSLGNKFDIGVLRAPRDLVADIDWNVLSQEDINRINDTKDTDYYNKRRIAGLDKKPQLLIYRIDGESTVETAGGNRNTSNRTDLEAAADVIGVCITIPGAKNSNEYAKKVTVKLDPIFEEDDLENQ